MKLLTMLVLALVGARAAGEEIEKLAMSEASVANFHLMSMATNGSACFVIENGCYQKAEGFPVLSLNPQQTLRAIASVTVGQKIDNSAPQNQTVGVILSKLYPDAWSTIQDYPDFTVQNFAWEKNRNNEHFVVEVKFKLTRNGEPQSNFIFGEIKTGANGETAVDVTSYSDANEQQELNRRSLKRLDNILNNRDFMSPMAQVQWQDFKRVQAVGATIAAWVSAMRVVPGATVTVVSEIR